MEDKKIRIGVDGKAAENFQSKMRQSADQLAKEMIRSSMQYSNSSKEVLRDLNEQIRAIEKRNKLDFEFRKGRLDSAHQGGAINEDQYKSKISNLSSDSREDKLQTSLLREIVEQIKTTSKEEIRENRIGVSRRISEGKVGDTEEEKLKTIIQKDSLSGGSVRQRSGGASLGGVSSLFRGAASGDMGGMVSGASGMIGSVGGGAAMGVAAAVAAVGLLLDQTKKSESNFKKYAITFEKSLQSIIQSAPAVRGTSKQLALSPEEYLSKISDYAISSGKTSGESFNQLAFAGTSRNIADPQIQQLLATQRYSRSGDSIGTVSSLENYLKETKQPLLRLPELLGSYLQVANGVLSRTGTLDSEALQRSVTAIGSTYNVNGMQLGRMTSGIESGLMKSQNPVARALQYQTLSSIHPNMSLWGMNKTMEDPLSDEKYMKSMIGKIKGMGGGGENAKFMMKQFFPQLSANEVDKIFSSGSLHNVSKGGNIDYVKEVEPIMGQVEVFASSIGKMKDEMVADFSSLLSAIFGTPENKKAISSAVEEGTTRANSKNPSLRTD
jgi:hypothetical protein